MAESHTRAMQTEGVAIDAEGTVTADNGHIEKEITGAKDDPIAMPRLPEDGNAGGRSHAYAQAGEKDVLPEHTARIDAYPLITTSDA